MERRLPGGEIINVGIVFGWLWGRRCWLLLRFGTIRRQGTFVGLYVLGNPALELPFGHVPLDFDHTNAPRDQMLSYIAKYVR